MLFRALLFFFTILLLIKTKIRMIKNFLHLPQFFVQLNCNVRIVFFYQVHNLVLPFCTHIEKIDKGSLCQLTNLSDVVLKSATFSSKLFLTSSSHQVLMRHAFILEVCLCIVLKKVSLSCVNSEPFGSQCDSHETFPCNSDIYYLLNKLQEYISLSAIGCYLDETQVFLVLSTMKFVAISWEKDQLDLGGKGCNQLSSIFLLFVSTLDNRISD